MPEDDPNRKTSLATLLADARERARRLAPRRAELEAAAAARPAPPAWAGAFAGPDLAVIAEVKRRSPSAGAIAADLDPVRHARAYVRGGARAVSVLTDPVHFGGAMADLTRVAQAVQVPVLRKDFILDPLQLVEARAAGAAAVLLIVRALAPGALSGLLREAAALGLGVLTEVHDGAELARALDAGATIIGVNARDLDGFAMRPEGVEPILAGVPPGCVAVAESGIATRADVARVAGAGADGILVGTAVARSADPAAAVRALCHVPRRQRTKGAG